MASISDFLASPEVFDVLRDKDKEFILSIRRRVGTAKPLSESQEKWLRNLYDKHSPTAHSTVRHQELEVECLDDIETFIFSKLPDGAYDIPSMRDEASELLADSDLWKYVAPSERSKAMRRLLHLISSGDAWSGVSLIEYNLTACNLRNSDDNDPTWRSIAIRPVQKTPGLAIEIPPTDSKFDDTKSGEARQAPRKRKFG